MIIISDIKAGLVHSCIYSCTILLISLFLFSCEQEKVDQETRILKIPKFDQENAYRLIEQQLSFGPRSIDYEGRQQCVDWMYEQMKNYNFHTQKQEFNATLYTGKETIGTNIVARWKPNVKERILLAAHWDSRPIADKDSVRMDQAIPGADDGASGVAVIMEIADQINKSDLPMGVDVVFFDLEDFGEDGENADYKSWGLGSQYWSKNLPDNDYVVKYGIVLVMVGAKNAVFQKEKFSVQNAGPYVDKIWSLAAGMSRSNYFKDIPTDGIVDDHLFIMQNAKIPVVYIANIEEGGGFASYHHTHQDDIDIISKETLSAVGQVMLATVFRESNKNL